MDANTFVILSAVATIALAVFAGVQLALEAWRRRDARAAALLKARGPAWLARRALERILAEAASYKDVLGWRSVAAAGDRLDRMEGQLLDVLHHAASAGGRHKVSGESALVDFLAFADRLNELSVMPLSGADGGGGRYPTDEDRVGARELANQVLMRAKAAIRHLEYFAPREVHEPRLPEIESLRVLDAPLPNKGLQGTPGGL